MGVNSYESIPKDIKLIYLDQNVLSRLRSRNIEKEMNEELKILKKLLTSKNNKFQVVYSHPTLIEIDQIKNENYKNEHIELLEELNALYILEPETKKEFGLYIHPNLSPTEAWRNYLKDKNENLNNGLQEYLEIVDLQGRKIFDLIKEPTFQKLYNKCCNIYDLLFSEKDTDVLSEQMKKNYENLKMFLQKQIGKDNEVLLNVKLIREGINKKIPDLNKIPMDQIIPEILKLAASDYSGFHYYRHETLNKVVNGYKLLNMVGYYPDDFTKLKRNKDRYSASYNDSYHVGCAIGVDFLISNDERLRYKANICYSYARVDTQACSIDDFLNFS